MKKLRDLRIFFCCAVTIIVSCLFIRQSLLIACFGQQEDSLLLAESDLFRASVCLAARRGRL